jgi:hypothetical protein
MVEEVEVELLDVEVVGALVAVVERWFSDFAARSSPLAIESISVDSVVVYLKISDDEEWVSLISMGPEGGEGDWLVSKLAFP